MIITVKRNGKIKTIQVDKLLVGDIISIESGDLVGADCLLITGADLAVNTSSLTGESFVSYKKPLPLKGTLEDPFILAGSTIVEGKGKAVVCNVGPNTEMGKIQLRLEDHINEITPLQRKLGNIADGIAYVGIFFAVVTVLAMSVNLVWDIYNSQDRYILSVATLKIFVDIIILGIVIIVVAVPEGLPLAVTLSLAYSVNKMK